jgi:hypothetical protein
MHSITSTLRKVRRGMTATASPSYEEKPKIVVLQPNQQTKPNPKFHMVPKKTLPPPTKAEQIAALKRPWMVVTKARSPLINLNHQPRTRVNPQSNLQLKMIRRRLQSKSVQDKSHLNLTSHST